MDSKAQEILALSGAPRSASAVVAAMRKLGIRKLSSMLSESTLPAIIDGETGKATTHCELKRLVESAGGSSGRMGVSLENGPTAAAWLLATIANGCAVPLDTRHTEREIESEMQRTRVETVVVDDKSGPAARAAARLKLKVLAVGECFGGDVRASMETEALILKTSGTSGTSKLVPHTLENLVAGALNVVASWGLTESDVCLNMMPLTHVGGIVRNLLAPILAGGAVVACPGFDPSRFKELCAKHGVTWYYASPTMHELFVKAVAGKDAKLRLVANASAPLSHKLAVKLRDTFPSAVVLPSYGMTECMPMSTPPLDYKLDRPGTSGVAVGPELAILNDDGARVAHDVTGRICVRGPPVFHGYEGAAPVDGWFDTGDLGYLDCDSYLYVTGRAKEVINRGGETIAPTDIEDVVISHPDVDKCMVFAQPHEALDEVVGLVVVVQGKERPDLAALHRFCDGKLHASKWPQILVYAAALPTNALKKIQRIKFAERAGLTDLDVARPIAERHFEATCPPPGPLTEPIPVTRLVVSKRKANTTESGAAARLAELVADITGADAQPHDHLSSLGFDSLNILQLKNRIGEALGATVPMSLLMRNPTIKEICENVGDDDALKLSMDAVMGFRTLLCWVIIRSHGGRHFGEKKQWQGVLCDSNANDTFTIWHTSLFVFLSGMQMMMQYDAKTTNATELLANFLSAILPVYYLAMAIMAPIGANITVWGTILASLVQTPWYYPGISPTWYLWSQFWCVLLFNFLRRMIKTTWCCEGTAPHSSCCGHDRADDEESQQKKCCGCSASLCGRVLWGSNAERPPPTTLSEFLRGPFFKWGLAASMTNFAWNPWPPVRSFQFALGMVVGQAVLHVRLSTRERRFVARVVDFIFVAAVASKFAPKLDQFIFYFLHNIPLAFMLFGLARASDHSFVAKLLSSELFTAFVPFTYAAYILHFPFYYYMVWINDNRIDSYEMFVNYLFTNQGKRTDGFTSRGWDGSGDKCGLPWGAHIMVFCLTLVAALVVTVLVHKPASKFLAKHRLIHKGLNALVDAGWRRCLCRCACLPCAPAEDASEYFECRVEPDIETDDDRGATTTKTPITITAQPPRHGDMGRLLVEDPEDDSHRSRGTTN